MVNLDMSRQYMIYDPTKSNMDITIIGVGSTGSFLALTLAKMGCPKIKVIDYDIVENHNISNQFFRFKDIGKPKVDALKEIIEEFTGNKIITENIKIDENYDFDLSLNSVVILCVDSIEARKLIFEKIKDFPIRLIDTRFGGEAYSIHNANLGDDEDIEKFAKSLEVEVMDTTCGQKGIIYTILSLAAEVSNLIKRIDKDESRISILRRNLASYMFIGGRSNGK